MFGTEIKKTHCRLCMHFCPVQVHVANGEVIKVEADSFNNNGRRFLCERAFLGALGFHNHPQRLNYPLKRVGAKGEGNWSKVPWQQAMDEIAVKLDNIRARYGPEALALMLGHGNAHFSWAMYRWRNRASGIPPLVKLCARQCNCKISCSGGGKQFSLA